jgi:hypothetical protein
VLSGVVLLLCSECWALVQRPSDELESGWPVCDNPRCGLHGEPLEVLAPVVVDQDLIDRNLAEIIEQGGVAGLERLIDVAAAARDALADA